MTNLTKRALADSLKKLLSRRPMDRITVQDVTDDAAVSRKTFYYHFHDIYDLMEWLVVDEGTPAYLFGPDSNERVQAFLSKIL